MVNGSGANKYGQQPEENRDPTISMPLSVSATAAAIGAATVKLLTVAYSVLAHLELS